MKRPTTPPTVSEPRREQRDPVFVQIEDDLKMDRDEEAAQKARARAAIGNPTMKTATPTPSALGRRTRRKRSLPSLPPKIHERLLQVTVMIAETLRSDPDLTQAITENLRAFRSNLFRALEKQFPLKRGRPRDPQLDALSRRLDHGEPDREILRAEFPHFDTLQPLERDLMVRGLHQAANRRRPKARKATRIKSRKKTRNKQSAIPPPNQPVN